MMAKPQKTDDDGFAKPSSLIRFRFRLRTLLFWLVLISLMFATLASWHRRSIAQFKALTTVDASNGLFVIDFNSELYIDPSTGMWRTSSGASVSSRVQAWLCRYFSPEYVLTVDSVYLHNSDSSEIEFVEQLKGVQRVVFFSAPPQEVVELWKENLPHVDILTETEWHALESKDAR